MIYIIFLDNFDLLDAFCFLICHWFANTIKSVKVFYHKTSYVTVLWPWHQFCKNKLTHGPDLQKFFSTRTTFLTFYAIGTISVKVFCHGSRSVKVLCHMDQSLIVLLFKFLFYAIWFSLCNIWHICPWCENSLTHILLMQNICKYVEKQWKNSLQFSTMCIGILTFELSN